MRAQKPVIAMYTPTAAAGTTINAMRKPYSFMAAHAPRALPRSAHPAKGMANTAASSTAQPMKSRKVSIWQ